MNNIAGIYCWSASQYNPENLIPCYQRALFHRQAKEGSWSNKHCALFYSGVAYTHEQAHQDYPLIAAQKNLVMVSSARLDNREELIEKLEVNAHLEHPVSDDALILMSYIKWGELCAEKLLGDFAFAIYNKNKKHLYCARDQLGVLPFLYHHEVRKQFVFSTSFKGIFATPKINRRINEEMIADRLVHNASASPDLTFYKNVHQLPSGCFALICENGMKINRYWEWSPNKDSTCKNPNDYAAELEPILNNAVQKRLRSIKPVGSHFSGGLDSSSVVAFAAQELQKKNQCLHTYTQVAQPGYTHSNENTSADDSKLIHDVCLRYPNIKSSLIDNSNSTLDVNLEEYFNWVEMPPLTPYNQLWLDSISAKAQADGLGGLLTGDSGNMSISYAGKHEQLATLIKTTHVSKFLSEIKFISAKTKKPYISQLIHESSKLAFYNFAAPLLNARYSQTWRKYSLINLEFAKQTNIDARLKGSLRGARVMTPEIQQQFRINKLTAPNPLYALMRHALYQRDNIRILDPTSDLRVVEFCLNAPLNAYFFQGYDRFLIRKCMDQHLPHNLIWRTQKGLQAADWMITFQQSLDKVKSDISTMKKSDFASKCLDLKLMEQLVEKWPMDWRKPQNNDLYKNKLSRAWIMGRYLLWLEQRATL